MAPRFGPDQMQRIVGLPLQLSHNPLKLAMNSRMLTLKNVGTTGIACRLVALVTSLLIRLALADRPNDQVQRLRPSQEFTLGNRCRGLRSAAAPSSDRWFARMPLLKTILPTDLLQLSLADETLLID